eukprot:8298732-Prorocentrum_lima.AAC.1
MPPTSLARCHVAVRRPQRNAGQFLAPRPVSEIAAIPARCLMKWWIGKGATTCASPAARPLLENPCRQT